MRIQDFSNSQSVSDMGTVREDEVIKKKELNMGKEDSKEKKEQNKIKEGDLIKSIEAANKDILIYDRKFEFSIHDATKEIMVKIIDVKTDKVIREIPPKKILDMVAKMWELAGILVDEKV